MIVSRFKGRLGNQMFEYAAAFAAAKESGTDLSIYRFELETVHRGSRYDLDALNIDKSVRLYTGIPAAMYLITIKGIISRLFKVRKERFDEKEQAALLGLKGIEILQETPFSYSKLPPLEPQKCYVMDGFFQSPRYFDKYRGELIRQYSPSFVISNGTKEILDEVGNSNSVSIHVRRGDYVSLDCCLSMKYYYDAVEYISARVDKPRFFVFSDDIGWVKENLKVAGDITYVERNVDVHPYEDIWLMKHCRHNIIANSTFSWWGGI